jgi:hypothetical protein
MKIGANVKPRWPGALRFLDKKSEDRWRRPKYKRISADMMLARRLARKFNRRVAIDEEV